MVEGLAGGVQIVDRHLFTQLQRAGCELFDRFHLAEAVGAGAGEIGDECESALRLGEMGDEAPHGVVGQIVNLGRDGDHPAAEGVERRMAGYLEVVPFTRFGVEALVGAGPNIVAPRALDDEGLGRSRARNSITVVGLGDTPAVHGVERIAIGEVGTAGRGPVLHLLGPLGQGADEAGVIEAGLARVQVDEVGRIFGMLGVGGGARVEAPPEGVAALGHAGGAKVIILTVAIPVPAGEELTVVAPLLPRLSAALRREIVAVGVL